MRCAAQVRSSDWEVTWRFVRDRGTHCGRETHRAVQLGIYNEHQGPIAGSQSQFLLRPVNQFRPARHSLCFIHVKKKVGFTAFGSPFLSSDEEKKLVDCTRWRNLSDSDESYVNIPRPSPTMVAFRGCRYSVLEYLIVDYFIKWLRGGGCKWKQNGQKRHILYFLARVDLRL